MGMGYVSCRTPVHSMLEGRYQIAVAGVRVNAHAPLKPWVDPQGLRIKRVLSR